MTPNDQKFDLGMASFLAVGKAATSSGLTPSRFAFNSNDLRRRDAFSHDMVIVQLFISGKVPFYFLVFL